MPMKVLGRRFILEGNKIVYRSCKTNVAGAKLVRCIVKLSFGKENIHKFAGLSDLVDDVDDIRPAPCKLTYINLMNAILNPPK